MPDARLERLFWEVETSGKEISAKPAEPLDKHSLRRSMTSFLPADDASRR